MSKDERTLTYDFKKHFNIDIDEIQPTNGLIEQIAKSLAELRDLETYKRLEVVLNENLITTKDIINNYRTILGCRVSYADLENNISFVVREDNKPSYEELEKRIDKAIEYIEDRMIVEQSFCLDMKQCYELTEILKGDSNEME